MLHIIYKQTKNLLHTGVCVCVCYIYIYIYIYIFFMNGNTERAQCALSLVCIPQEMEK